MNFETRVSSTGGTLTGVRYNHLRRRKKKTRTVVISAIVANTPQKLKGWFGAGQSGKFMP
jgi:hypothetical protein